MCTHFCVAAVSKLRKMTVADSRVKPIVSPFLSTANVDLWMRRFSGVANNVSIVERRNECELDHALNVPGNRRCHPTTRSYCHLRDAHAWSDNEGGRISAHTGIDSYQ